MREPQLVLTVVVFTKVFLRFNQTWQKTLESGRTVVPKNKMISTRAQSFVDTTVQLKPCWSQRID